MIYHHLTAEVKNFDIRKRIVIDGLILFLVLRNSFAQVRNGLLLGHALEVRRVLDLKPEVLVEQFLIVADALDEDDAGGLVGPLDGRCAFVQHPLPPGDGGVGSVEDGHAVDGAGLDGVGRRGHGPLVDGAGSVGR